MIVYQNFCESPKTLDLSFKNFSPFDSISIKLNSMLDCSYLFDRDKKKIFAPNAAAFYPFGVDVFVSPRKIDHIARFVELPVINSSGDVPAILVVNLQVIFFPYSLKSFFFSFFHFVLCQTPKCPVE